MSINTLLKLGLLASSALAAPEPWWKHRQWVKTVTVTEAGNCDAATSKTSHTTTPHTTPHTTTSHTTTPHTTTTSKATTSSKATSVTTTTSQASDATTTTLLATATAANMGLNKAAKMKGKLWFGTAADIPGTGELQDNYYMKEFNNSLDWGEGELYRDHFDDGMLERISDVWLYSYTGQHHEVCVYRATAKRLRFYWWRAVPRHC